MNQLFRLFLRSVERDPFRRVLCARPGGSWITFRELEGRAERLADRLRAAGLQRREVAAIRVGNRPAFIASTLAVWSLGGVMLPMDESLPAAVLADLVRAFRPRLILAAPRGRVTLDRLPGETGPLRLAGLAMIRLTSGTTGRPRGAGISAAQVVADGRAIIRSMGIRSGDVNVAAIPLNHSYGFDNIVLPLLLQGTPAVLLRRPLPGLIFRALQSRRPLVFPAVPYLLDLLSRQPGPVPRGGLRLCVSAGAPLPAAVADGFRRRFGLAVRNFYGSSETGGIAFDGGPEPGTGEGCVGAALPGVRIRLDRRGLGDLPRGTGRIVVSGPAVGSGHLPDPSPDLRHGRFRTQDLGRLDGRGRLCLVGRLASLVNVSGRNVNPAEVESALLELEGIRDAVVLGLEDPLRGERLEAWVVTAGGGPVGTIRTALGRRIARYKIPRRIHAVRRIPRTARGKVDRVRLLRRA